ncbi:MAG: DUF6040 family protein, partial [Lachnospiraceae bacterium]|nr:DUF6040 family protein [Lachnospiraceae bacterium]
MKYAFVREQGRSDKGHFDSTNLEVHDFPMLPTDDDPDNGDREDETQQISDDSPCPENPDTVNPDTEKPCAENQPQYNTHISNTNKSNNNTSNMHRVCKADTLTDSEYDDLVSEFGKDSVDYQINRIRDHGYKGCYNFDTIKAWCKERLNRPVTTPLAGKKKNSFFNFMQRDDYDWDELERVLLSIACIAVGGFLGYRLWLYYRKRWCALSQRILLASFAAVIVFGDIIHKIADINLVLLVIIIQILYLGLLIYLDDYFETQNRTYAWIQ